MGKVILVSSGKGGTGKTMFSVNLGALLAEKGYKTILLDMDMGLRNMDLYLGMENKVVYNIMDVMSGICRIKKAMIQVNGFTNLYFMAASPRRDDCPAGINDLFDVALAPTQKAVLVTEPEMASLRDADVTERYLTDHGITDTYIVINKVRADLMRTGMIPSLSVIANMFKGQIAGIIQDDDNIHISTNKGIPIVCKKGTYIEENFQDIAYRILFQ